jgi:hypothetical protein
MGSGSFELRIAAHSRGVEKLYHESAQNATKKRPHAQTSAAFLGLFVAFFAGGKALLLGFAQCDFLWIFHITAGGLGVIFLASVCRDPNGRALGLNGYDGRGVPGGKCLDRGGTSADTRGKGDRERQSERKDGFRKFFHGISLLVCAVCSDLRNAQTAKTKATGQAQMRRCSTQF